MKKALVVVCVGLASMALAAGSVSAVNSSDLVFSTNHNDLGAAGSSITTWGGLSTTSGAKPTVSVDANGVKWENNTNNPGTYMQAGDKYTTPLELNGATIVTRVKAKVAGGESWNPYCIVNVFYDKIALGMEGDGTVFVIRDGDFKWSRTLGADSFKLTDGQEATLSLTVQNDGAWELWMDGVSKMSGGAKNTFGTLTPSGFRDAVNVGGRYIDGWACYNGYIGDTYMYKTALTNSERLALENTISANYGMTVTPEPGTLLALGALLAPASMMLRRRK